MTEAASSTTEAPAAGEDAAGQLVVLEALLHHCPPVTTRDLFWNWTSAGDLAIQPCPGGSSGFAKWRCGAEAAWAAASPDLGECQSHWLARLGARLRSDGDVAAVAAELPRLLSSRTLYGGDLAAVTQLLQSLAHRARQRLFTVASQEEKERLAAVLAEATLKVGSLLLEDSLMLAWSDLEPVERAQVGSSLVLAIQENSFFLADTVNVEKDLVMMEDNLLTSVRIMRARELRDQTFSSRSGSVDISIPAESLVENSENGAVRLVFTHYTSLDHVLPSSTNGVKFLNSGIASAALSRGHAALLSAPLTATFRHLEQEGMAGPVCVWWDHVSRTWAEDGCWVAETNASVTSCRCDRLGSLALLMEEASLAAPRSTAEGGAGPGTLTVVVAAVVSVAVAAVALAATFIIVRRLSCKLRTKLPCLEAAQASSPGYYPYLSSSNTSTTITATTPDKNTAAGSQYFLNTECQVLRPLMIAPLGPNSTIYRATFANGQQAHVIPIEPAANDGNKYQFRPITPSASHIYMEIDPVYNSETMSDILVSDTSDDDLKRSSDERLLAAQSQTQHQTLSLSSMVQQQQQQQQQGGRVPSTLHTRHHLHHQQQQQQQQQAGSWGWGTGARLPPHSLQHGNNAVHSVFQ